MSIVRILNKFNRLLSSYQKTRVLQLTILMVIGGILETVSVSLMIPLIDGILNTDELMGKWYARLFCDIFHIDSDKVFLISLVVILSAVFIAKNLYLVLEYDVQYKFVYGNMFEMQKKILRIFLHRPYEFFMGVNSGETIRIINQDVVIVYSLLSTLLLFFTEMIITVMLIIGIFIIAPIITVCVAVILCGIVILIYLSIKPTLKKEGEVRNDALSEMNKWLIQAIEGIKEIKVMKKETYFQNKFENYGAIYIRSQRLSSVLGVMPRFIIEGGCLSSMFIAVAVMIYADINLESLIPILTAVAMAAIRLLPSVNRISSYLTQLAYGEPTLDKVIENMSEIEGFKDDDPKELVFGNKAEGICVTKYSECRNRNASSKNIYIDNISYHYPNSDEDVLKNVSAVINEGDAIGIVGVSGAGKTTLVDLILGILTPQSGKIMVEGENIGFNPKGWLDRIGYIPQMIFMLDGSIRDNIAFGEEGDNVSDDEIWRALEEAALKEYVAGLPKGLDTQIGERGIRLSGGQRQRIGIARALYKNPDVLIFDEATSALDSETESEIMSSIDGLHGKKTMIIIAHRLTTIESCDHVFRVESGKVLLER